MASHADECDTRRNGKMGSQQATGTITGLVGDIVSDTMHFVDDLLGRLNEVEVDLRGAVTDLVEVEGAEASPQQEVADLRAALTELQTKAKSMRAGAKKS
jgi:hypothetical protein